MPSSDTIDVLNRVLTILERSFPQYVRYARPYVSSGDDRAVETFAEIADAQDALARRVSQQIFDSGSLPNPGDFAIEFTDTHDLDIEYLVREAIGYQKQDIADLHACVDALLSVPMAKVLAEEALGMSKGHLESLEELTEARNSAATQPQ